MKEIGFFLLSITTAVCMDRPLGNLVSEQDKESWITNQVDLIQKNEVIAVNFRKEWRYAIVAIGPRNQIGLVQFEAGDYTSGFSVNFNNTNVRRLAQQVRMKKIN